MTKSGFLVITRPFTEIENSVIPSFYAFIVCFS